jgi:hypothetical protein
VNEQRCSDPAFLAELESRDKRKTAVHEAGHATVAAAMGLRVRAWLIRTNTVRPLDEKIWVGKAQGRLNPVSSVAGMVAEKLDADPDVQTWEIIQEWEEAGDEDAGLSPTDMELVPQDWESRTALVESALAILREQKRLFDWLVSELVEHECVTDGMVADFINPPAWRSPT